MDIKNCRNRTVELSYPGMIPVKVAAGETVHNVPVVAYRTSALRRDLVAGSIAVTLAPHERDFLRGLPAPQPTSDRTRTAKDRPSRPEREMEDRQVVDLVANEMAARLMLLKPEAREEELKKYKRSTNPNFLNAVAETERRVRAAHAAAAVPFQAPGLSPDGGGFVQLAEPAVPDAPAQAAPSRTAAEKPMSLSDRLNRQAQPAASVSASIPSMPSDRPEGSKPVPQISVPTQTEEQESMTRNQLFKLAKSRGLQTSSKMTAAELQKLLMGAE